MRTPVAYKNEIRRRDYIWKSQVDFSVSKAKAYMYSLPYIGNEDKMMFEMKKLKMNMVNFEIINKILGYFRWHTQRQSADRLLTLIPLLSVEERDMFDVDFRKLDMVKHAQTYVYGIGRYYCGLDLLPPGHEIQQVLKLNTLDWNHDMKFASGANVKEIDLQSFSANVLNAQKF